MALVYIFRKKIKPPLYAEHNKEKQLHYVDAVASIFTISVSTFKGLLFIITLVCMGLTIVYHFTYACIRFFANCLESHS